MHVADHGSPDFLSIAALSNIRLFIIPLYLFFLHQYWICLKYVVLFALRIVHTFEIILVLFYKVFVFSFRILSNVVRNSFCV